MRTCSERQSIAAFTFAYSMTAVVICCVRAVQLVGQVLQLPVVRDTGLAKLHQKTAQALQAAGGAQAADSSYAASSLTNFLTQAGKFFGKDPTKWEAVGQGKVSPAALKPTLSSSSGT